MAGLSGVGQSLPGLFDVLETRAAALEAAHAHGIGHDTPIAEVLQSLWSDISSHASCPATAHDVVAGIEAIASHLREALHAGHDGGHLLV